MDMSDSLDDDLSERSQFLYTALSFLLTRNPDSIIPEVCYFLDPDQIMTFIKVYGGRTMRIPTTKEFSNDMYAALAAYYRVTYKYSWKAIQTRLALSNAQMSKIQPNVEDWLQKMTEQNLELPEFLKGKV